MWHEACPHCGERAWIDLGRESTALMLHQHEAHEVRTRLRPVDLLRAGAWGGAVGVIAGALLVGTLGGGALLAGSSALLAGAWVAWQRRRPGPPPSPLPSRWSMALPPTGPVREAVSGPVRVRGEPLTAPLSGRACMAYEVGVRHDGRGSAPASTWVLIEQRVAPLEVEGRALDPSSTHLVLPRQRLGTYGTVELDAAAEAFLRERGLGSPDTVLELFETILEAGTEVEVERTEHGATLRTRAVGEVVRAIEGAPGPAPALPPASR
ncbi:hypothetical protein [Paraliomyxa miuraensis]|uniref:hypothetical protein n=1 Tax=Paraliomyxa miuraensis TaxID=376150 RepID=UPI0022545570|nr:hypothetical protein [Paraliomyxa miuraensis]MCX4241069.1 hypothetical protein [Paraliomyxa miuraensis]